MRLQETSEFAMLLVLELAFGITVSCRFRLVKDFRLLYAESLAPTISKILLHLTRIPPTKQGLLGRQLQ